MASMREPTLRAAWLGEELRGLRKSAGIDSREMGRHLRKAQSGVSRIESGLYPAREDEVIAYLDICKVTNQRKRRDLLTMTRDVSQRGWWDGYEPDAATTIIDRMWMEARTTQVKTCDLTYLPGLLQTPEYAAALFRAGNPDAHDQDLKRWQSFRMTRQHIISGHQRVSLRCVIAEKLLGRRTGGDEVMCGQLNYLASVGKQANIEIRLLPEEACDGVDGSFELLTLTDPYPRVGFVVTPVGDICVEGDQVEKLDQNYDRLWELSLSPKVSQKRILTMKDKA